MKIFRINNGLGDFPERALRALSGSDAPSPDVVDVSLLPDSATVNRGRPVFVPDFVDATWRLALVPMFRIGRLGKYIEPRFAYRYVDGVGLGATLMPARDIEQRAVPALGAAFDGALAMGAFLDINTEYSPLLKAAGLQVCAGGRRAVTGMDEMHLFDAVALLSRYCTLRTGDVVIPGIVAGVDMEPLVDTLVEAEGTLGTLVLPPLSFRLK